MKNILLVAILLAFTSMPVLAQKKLQNKDQQSSLHKRKALKKETAAWRKRKNAMKPLQFKDLIEENHRLKMQVQQLDVQLKQEATHSSQLQADLERLANLQTKEALQQTPANATPGIEQTQNSPDRAAAAGKETDWLQGLVFKVQIGAYKKRDLSHILPDANQQAPFQQEKEATFNKYTISHFRDYAKANAFKKELRAMGLKDAWIVPYKDGHRIALKEALAIANSFPQK